MIWLGPRAAAAAVAFCRCAFVVSFPFGEAGVGSGPSCTSGSLDHPGRRTPFFHRAGARPHVINGIRQSSNHDRTSGPGGKAGSPRCSPGGAGIEAGSHVFSSPGFPGDPAWRFRRKEGGIAGRLARTLLDYRRSLRNIWTDELPRRFGDRRKGPLQREAGGGMDLVAAGTNGGLTGARRRVGGWLQVLARLVVMNQLRRLWRLARMTCCESSPVTGRSGGVGAVSKL